MYRDTHRPKLLDQWPTCCLFLHNEGIGLPFFPMFEGDLFKFWEWDSVFESVKEDKLGLVVLFLVVPDPPSSTGRIVGGCFGFMRRVP